MKPTPEIEAQGLKAYEQARAFERLRSWRLPLSYVLFAMIPVVGAVALWRLGHAAQAEISLAAAVAMAGVGWLQWKMLKARYVGNLRLLAELKARYGDELPWVQVEEHLAALAELKRELAAVDERDL